MKSQTATLHLLRIFRFRKSVGFLGMIFVFLILLGFDVNQNQDKSLIKKVVFINPSKNTVISTEEKNDLHSLKYSLFVAGINFSETSIDKLNSIRLFDFDVIVLPYAAAKNLNDPEVKIIKDAVNNGSYILLDGTSKMNEAIEVSVQKESIFVSQIRDLQFPKNVLYWTDSVEVLPIDTTQNKYHPLCIDETTQLPLAVSGTYGKGKFIFLSALFDPITDKGYSRFPFLIETLHTVFDLKALAGRKSVEMFFDPGMRDGSISIQDLVKLWRKRDIKRIYAAGWYFDYGYDYETLINSCHANGILVYCWLETPMISKGFWDKHPEWREKTAYLKDANIDWRYLMNLANDDCRKEVFNILEKLLISNDWDGVNLAELYFEPSPVGPELPENFTPMNDVVRKEFKSASGFDPVFLFDTSSPHYWKTNHDDWKKFSSYRKDLCYRLKQNFLDFLTTIEKKKKDFEVMLTVIDVSMTPELSDNIAEDTQYTLSLYSKYGITMQIEDPSNCWGLTPERYNKLGQYYRKYIKEQNRLVFDCNVVNSHEMGYGGFPAEKPSGEEIRQIVYNMSLNNSRPAFYAEDAVSENDFVNISAVLARDAKIVQGQDKQWKISTPYAVFVNIGGKDIPVKLDDKLWFAREGDHIIIPPGNHTLEFVSERIDEGAIVLKSISGELKWANFLKDALEFSYDEEMNSCFVIINKQPADIYIDAKKTECEIFKNDTTEYTIKLPKGTHDVKITL